MSLTRGYKFPHQRPVLRKFHEAIGAMGFRSTNKGLSFFHPKFPGMKFSADVYPGGWWSNRERLFCDREKTLKLLNNIYYLALRDALIAQKEGNGALGDRQASQPMQNSL